MLKNSIIQSYRGHFSCCNDLPHVSSDKSHAEPQTGYNSVPPSRRLECAVSLLSKQPRDLLTAIMGCRIQPTHNPFSTTEQQFTYLPLPTPGIQGGLLILTAFSWSGSTVMIAWSLNCSLILLSIFGNFPPKKNTSSLRKEENQTWYKLSPLCALPSLS